MVLNLHTHTHHHRHDCHTEPEPDTALARKETLKEKLEDAEDLKVRLRVSAFCSLGCPALTLESRLTPALPFSNALPQRESKEAAKVIKEAETASKAMADKFMALKV